MELDRKIRYATLAVTAVSVVLAGLGLHGFVHIRPSDGGGVAD